LAHREKRKKRDRDRGFKVVFRKQKFLNMKNAPVAFAGKTSSSRQGLTARSNTK